METMKLKITTVFMTLWVGLMWLILSIGATGGGGDTTVTTNYEKETVGETPVSQIAFRAYGGRSPVDEYGIAVREYRDRIVMRAFEIWRSGGRGFDKETTLSRPEYEELWKELEKYGVWKIEPSEEPEFFDAFNHDFIFTKDGEIKEIHHVQELEGPLWQIVLTLDDWAKRKLGVNIYKKR